MTPVNDPRPTGFDAANMLTQDGSARVVIGAIGHIFAMHKP
ncbi:MAG: hypothetical protein N6V49_00245 [Serratia symbiotica]|nr:hypothetical protein [Serratia symbiotica]